MRNLFTALLLIFSITAQAALPTRFGDVEVNGYLKPTNNGQDLGSLTRQWEAYLQSVYIGGLSAGALYLDSGKSVASLTAISPAELGYLDGVTSGIQAQIDTKLASSLATGKVWIGDGSSVAAARTMSGDATLSSAGDFQLAAGAVANADLAGSITDDKLSQIATAGKVANSATTAASANTPSAIVARDGSGNFVAGTITGTLSGSATNFSGNLVGDVSGTQGATVVDAVGGKTSAAVATSVNDTLGATDANTASKIVKRDASGNFTAGTITAAITGTASGNVPNARTVSTTAPLQGGGALSGNLTLTIDDGSSVARGVVNTSPQAFAGRKHFDNGVALKEIATPSAPSAGYHALYAKTDGKIYRQSPAGVEAEVGGASSGGGSGSGGVNFMATDSSFTPTKQNNSDLETSVGDWAAFADAAASEPVDLTGGSANVTCTRGTSSPLNNTGDLVITKDAANRQGQGCSAPFYVPPGYRGKTSVISFPFKIDTGSLVTGDIQVWIYDVTNSQKIKPYNLDIVGTQGAVVAKFDVPTTMSQGRLGVYFASSSATAVTARIDDIFSGFKEAVYGLAGSDTYIYAPTLNSTSNVTYNQAIWRRVGDQIHIKGTIRWSGTGSGQLTISLPTGLTADSTRVNAADSGAGTQPADLGNAMWIDAGNALFTMWPRIDSSTYTKFTFLNSAGSGFSQASTANGDQVQYEVFLPILGWSSNVSMAESSTFWISGILASGTRVTATPAKIGEYRAKYKAGSSQDFTGWTDTAPSTAPTSADGIRIWAKDYSTAGTSTNPNAYEIFIGKNMHFDDPVAWAATAHATQVSTKYYSTGALAWGLVTSYNPDTGVLFITAGQHNGSNTSAYIGFQQTGTQPTDGYFDVKISQNALAVGMQNPRSRISFYGNDNNVGSTATLRLEYDVLDENTGTAFSSNFATDQATNGTIVTILEEGVYCVGVTAAYTGAGTTEWGALLNPTSGTGSLESGGGSILLGGYHTNAFGSAFTKKMGCRRMVPGNTVAVHRDSNALSTADTEARFEVIKMSN